MFTYNGSEQPMSANRIRRVDLKNKTQWLAWLFSSIILTSTW
jgi:hypothetical protein